jgi:alpha-L-fucosidase 2
MPGTGKLTAFCSLAILIPSLALAATPVSTRRQQVLWYKSPAYIWDQALPVGNGRLGAMVFGGANTGTNNGDLQDRRQNQPLMNGSQTRAADEHLQLNESSIWQGSRANRLNPCAGEAFPNIRKLLLESRGTDAAKITEAEKLARQCMIAIPPGMPGYSTLGDLYLRSSGDGSVSDYRRELNLDNGIARVTYTQNGVQYTREVFASVPDDVIVMRIRASKRGAVSFTASMDRPADFAARTRGNDTLILREGPDHKDEIRFAGEVSIRHVGGAVTGQGTNVQVDKADSVIILITAASSFKGGPFAGGDPEQQCEQILHRAQKRSFEQILAAQQAHYQPLIRNMAFHLGPSSPANDALPTDERVKNVSAGADDVGLQELYFQFARYLLISASRDNGLPANLQGIWAAGISNPWGSKYTININTEMNYWPAEAAGLGQSILPLVNLIDMVRTPASGTGQQVAKKYYGARGFVIHHNTDLWGDAEAIDGVPYGIWPIGGAWLSLYSWDHYAYTLDPTFLRNRAWPILHDASQFFLDYLVDDGNGHLVTGPSVSPENQYKLADGSRHSLAMGPTMDIELVRELFTRTIDAGRILGEDVSFLTKIEQARSKLPPFAIGRQGRLQEWQQDYDDAEPGHRHISHLWALFPGTQINLRDTPELAAAARKTLEIRLAHGGGQTGWSRAWVINYWDHLHDAAQAYDSLQVMIRQSTFTNLMDTHPPGLFQIDGNLGAANGMLEALLQSRWTPDGVDMDLLPALPKQWAEGSVRGVHVRGNAMVDLAWKAGRLTSFALHGESDQVFRIHAPEGQSIAAAHSSKASIKLREIGTIQVKQGATISFDLQ